MGPFSVEGWERLHSRPVAIALTFGWVILMVGKCGNVRRVGQRAVALYLTADCTASSDNWESYCQALQNSGRNLIPIETNLVDLVWDAQKPPPPTHSIYALSDEFTGKPSPLLDHRSLSAFTEPCASSTMGSTLASRL